MDEIMNALRKIQKDLDDQKLEIRKSGKTITKQVTQNVSKILKEKLLNIKENQENMKEKIENQEKRIYFLEKQARQRHLVFFGIDEKETSYEGVQNLFIDFIKEHFSINIEPREVQELRRVGKPGERPRPLIVTFLTLGIKINILNKKVI